MSKMFLNAARLTLLGLLAAAAGCSSSRQTVFYTLEPYPSSVSVPGYRGPAVIVDAVHLPKDMDRLELIRRTGDYTMQVDDFSHWSAFLGDLAQRALTQDLAARLPAGSVIFPAAPKPADAMGLTVDVLDFDLENGQGTMDVSWAWDDSDTAAATGPRTLHLMVPADGTGPKAIADAMSHLLAEVADNVANVLGHDGSRYR